MDSGLHLGDLLDRVVELSGDSIALNCGEVCESYQDFSERVGSLAASLNEMGVGPGDRVCVLAPNCHRVVELYWALALLGACAVPIEPRLTSGEIADIIGATCPKALVASSWDKLAFATDCQRIAMTADSSDEEQPNLETFCQAQKPFHPPREVTPETPVLIMYTAAVSGKSRGAMLTHRNLVTQVVQTSEAFGLTTADGHGLLLPLSHTFGAYLMFVALARGVPTSVIANFDASQVVREIDRGNITFFAEFAPMGQRILDAAKEAQVNLAGKLRAVTGLEVPDTIEGYIKAGVDFYCLYGQTETSGLVCAGKVTTDSVVANYSGKALCLSHLSLRDDQGNPVKPGEPGELWVRSDCVVNRYWPNEPTNLTDEGWLKTGDLLSAEARGNLFFYGRVGARDLIKPGGLNVYPAEVEQVLMRHPRVAAALVFGTPDPSWREKVVAVVAPKDDGEGLEGALMEHTSKNLPSFKQPKVIIVDASLIVEGRVDASGIRTKYANV